MWQHRLQVAVGLLPLVAGWVAFHGALRYGFAQDDWVRLESAARPLWSAVTDFLSAGAAGRRPIEQLYFGAVVRLWGNSPVALHLLGALLHGANVLLVHQLLRRVVARGVALAGAIFVAVHSAAFTVVYWSSCAPELLTTHLSLWALVAALGGARAPSTEDDGAAPAWGWRELAAPVLYAGALGAKETPVLLPILAWTLGRAVGLRRDLLLRRVALLSVASAAFVAFYLIVKSGVTDPAYPVDVFSIGVLDRAATYLAWTHLFWRPIPFIDSVGPIAKLLVAGACAVALAIAWRQGRQRWRVAVSGASWIVVALAPAVAIAGHDYRYLCYLGLPGIALLWSPVGEAVLERIRWHSPSLASAALATTCVLAAVLGTRAARITELSSRHEPGHWARYHFVVRRALTAERALADLDRSAPPLTSDSAVILEPRVAMDEPQSFWISNMRAALGNGAALRVHLGLPDLFVHFAEDGKPSVPPSAFDYVVVYRYREDGSLAKHREARFGGPSVDAKQ